MGHLIKTQMVVPKPTGQPIVFNNVRENSPSKAKPYLDSYLVKINLVYLLLLAPGEREIALKSF
jgi:hypothetical protein